MKNIAIAALLTVMTVPCFSQTNPLNQNSFDAPLHKPTLSNQAIIDWTMAHIEEANTVSEKNVHVWSEKVKPYFTQKGYESFILTLPLKKKQYSATAKPIGQTQIITQGINKSRLSIKKGTYTWYVAVPVIKSVALPRSEVTTQDVCVLKIVRVKKSNHRDLVAIDNVECTDFAKNDSHPANPMPEIIKKVKKKVKLSPH